MSDEEQAARAAQEALDATIATIEVVNSLADSMTSMKSALEDRGWSTPMAEQIGANFGGLLFTMAEKGRE